jgi:phosphoglycolate phosphatase
MKPYSTILFDLDGTLTDPQVGITKSVQYALERMGITAPPRDELIHFIGPPLAISFREFYGMDQDQSAQAVCYYREYFSQTGIYENAVYAGIPELMEKLRSAGITLAVATSKPNIFANQILQHFALADFFAFVAGSELDGSRVEKVEVIEYALRNLPVTNHADVLMVGDRKHDVIGARLNSVDSLAVTYGYGSRAELISSEPTYLVETVEEILSYTLR